MESTASPNPPGSALPGDAQRGQAMTETLIGLALMLALLLWPFDGHASLLAYALDAVRQAHLRMLFAMSWVT